MPDYTPSGNQPQSGDTLAISLQKINDLLFGGSATSSSAPSYAGSAAYENSRVVKASAGVLRSLTGYSSNAGVQWVQVHDAAALPADTAIPKLILKVAATANFELILEQPIYFATGIVVCNSTTGPTKTIGAADTWFQVQYA